MTMLGEVIKSPSDSRTYKALKLQNDLQCLLIQDVDAMKSSAALSMGVGSLRDPPTAQGLAHYLEHMLFMGTAKYPDENDYSNFITKNGGSNNAYTSQQETNYMLQVSSAAFEPALDRFAQFFIAPLMKQQSAQKQIEAVHSEHQKNLLNDAWRRYQLSKHVAKQGHPFKKFSTGDKTTLMCQNLQQLLHQFYKDNYSSNLMKLVIYGKQDVETLQKWAKQKFSQIPNRNLAKFKVADHPYDKNAFGKLFKIVPIKDIKKLEITWILPNKKPYYRNHPGNYISNLIGHEGKGSILSYLMKQGLATSLSSGNSDTFDCYTELSVSMDLTEKGLQKYHEIIGYVLYYIKMLRQKQSPQWFFQQIKLINKLKFQFMDKRKGMSETSKMAKNMQERKIQQVILYPYLMEQWKPELVNQYLSELTQDNMFVFLSAKQFEPQCNLEEPVYKSKYFCEELKSLQPLQCNVDLPEKNIFLPKDLSIHGLAQEKLPQLIYQTQFLDTHFKQDHVFNLPKANINLRFNFLGNCTVSQDIGRSLLMEMFKEHLRQFTYLSEMAEIQTQISFASSYSLDIKFKGFRDSLKLYVVEYLNRLFSFVPSDQQYFDTLIQKNRRRYANYFLGDPYQLAYEKNSSCLRVNSSTSHEQKVIEINNVSLDDIVALNKNWKKKLFLESYFSGNITQAESKDIAESLEKFLISHSKPLNKAYAGQIRPVALSPNETVIIEKQLQNPDEENSCTVVCYQSQQLTIRNEMLLKLLQSVTKQPAFDYLRTKQQLGYIVFCLAEDHRCVGGLTIIVQSSVKSSYELITYINRFVNEKLKELIDNLSEQEFLVFKNAIKHSKQEKDKNLSAQTLRFWSEIVKHKYIFNRKSQEIETLNQITLPQFKQFVLKCLYSNPKIIQIHMVCNKKKTQNEEAKNARLSSANSVKVFNSVEAFQRKAQLFADFYAPNPNN